MSPAEILVSVICLIVGYWLVNTLMQKGPNVRGGNDAKSEPPHRSVPPPQDANDAKAWHEVLGVPKAATHAQVAAAYRQRISEYHPDKVAKMGAEIRAVAERKSKQINVAYAEALKHVRE
jgi:DnaJ like chaperone protein